MLCSVCEGVLQNYARKYHIPIDNLDFEYEMLSTEGKTMLKLPPEGAYIYVRYMHVFLSLVLIRGVENAGVECGSRHLLT